MTLADAPLASLPYDRTNASSDNGRGAQERTSRAIARIVRGGNPSRQRLPSFSFFFLFSLFFFFLLLVKFLCLALFFFFFCAFQAHASLATGGFLAPFSVLLSVAGSSKRTDLLEDTIFVH